MDPTHEISSQLKFIATIQAGDKINVVNKQTEEPGWKTSIMRWLIHPDRRENTLEFLSSIFTKSFRILDIFLKSTIRSERTLCLNIIKDLYNARDGVNNLKITYQDDNMFCCRLETLYESVLGKIEEIKFEHPIMFKSVDIILNETLADEAGTDDNNISEFDKGQQSTIGSASLTSQHESVTTSDDHLQASPGQINESGWNQESSNTQPKYKKKSSSSKKNNLKSNS